MKRWMPSVVVALGVLLAACQPAPSGTGSAGSAATSAPAPAPPPPTTAAAQPTASAAVSPAPSVLASPVAAATVPAAATGSAPGTTLKVGVTGNTADAPIYIADDRGYFKQEGLNVNLVTYQSATDAVGPLAAGQMDVAGGNVAAGLFNAIARGYNVKIVADKGQHAGSPKNGFTSALWLSISKKAADAGTYKTLADVKGKTIAITSPGSGPQVMLAKGLGTVGLTIKDVKFKSLSFPNMIPALANGSVDLAVEIEPFISRGKQQGILVPWKGSEELYAGQEGGVIMFGPTVTKPGSDVGTRFMTAYIKGVRDYYNAFGLKHQDQDAIISILTKHTSVKDPNLFKTMGFDYIDPNGYVNADAISYDLNWYHDNGYVQKAPNMSDVIDNTYVDQALKALGKVQP